MSRAPRRFGCAVAVLTAVGALWLGGLGLVRLARGCVEAADGCASASCVAQLERAEGALLLGGLAWGLGAVCLGAAVTGRRSRTQDNQEETER